MLRLSSQRINQLLRRGNFISVPNIGSYLLLTLMIETVSPAEGWKRYFEKFVSLSWIFLNNSATKFTLI